MVVVVAVRISLFVQWMCTLNKALLVSSYSQLCALFRWCFLVFVSIRNLCASTMVCESLFQQVFRKDSSICSSALVGPELPFRYPQLQSSYSLAVTCISSYQGPSCYNTACMDKTNCSASKQVVVCFAGDQHSGNCCCLNIIQCSYALTHRPYSGNQVTRMFV